MPVTIGYWDIRGLAAPMRMICHYGGLEFDENLYSLQEAKGGPSRWFKDNKPDLLKQNPCITLPYIKDGEKVITLSNAVYFYLGRKAGMTGNSDKEKEQVEAILFMSFDLRNDAVALLYGPKDKYDAGAKTYLQPTTGGGKTAHTYLKLMNDCLKIYGTKYVGGDTLSIADCALFEMVEMHNAWAKAEGVDTYLDKPEFAELNKLVGTIKADPKLAPYFASEAYTKLPFNNTNAHFFKNE